MPRGIPKVRRTIIYLRLDDTDAQVLDGLVDRMADRMGYLSDDEDRHACRDRLARAALRMGLRTIAAGDAEMSAGESPTGPRR